MLGKSIIDLDQSRTNQSAARQQYGKDLTALHEEVRATFAGRVGKMDGSVPINPVYPSPVGPSMMVLRHNTAKPVTNTRANIANHVLEEENSTSGLSSSSTNSTKCEILPPTAPKKELNAKYFYEWTGGRYVLREAAASPAKQRIQPENGPFPDWNGEGKLEQITPNPVDQSVAKQALLEWNSRPPLKEASSNEFSNNTDKRHSRVKSAPNNDKTHLSPNERGFLTKLVSYQEKSPGQQYNELTNTSGLNDSARAAYDLEIRNAFRPRKAKDDRWGEFIEGPSPSEARSEGDSTLKTGASGLERSLKATVESKKDGSLSPRAETKQGFPSPENRSCYPFRTRSIDSTDIPGTFLDLFKGFSPMPSEFNIQNFNYLFVTEQQRLKIGEIPEPRQLLKSDNSSI